MFVLRRLSPLMLSLLLAVTMLARLLVPMGWMPVATDSGIHVTLCSSAGPVTLVMGADGRFHHESPAAPRDPCPFGTASAALDLPGGIVLPPLPFVHPELIVPGLVTTGLIAWRGAFAFARGPPARA